jgi:(R,R)-butanediol dehydrogenase / meso-butanediol dehydrogenase / diacetyl reductase
MKAAVWYEKEDIRVEELPDPDPGPGQVKLKIRVCGICGTDLHEYRSGPFLIPHRPHPLTHRAGGPIVLGHEFTGEIVSMGEGVTHLDLGDRVVVNPLIYCGDCYYCKRGQHLMCKSLGTYGLAEDGAFAEYALFPAGSLHRLPDEVTDEAGAFVEPLAVAVHAVKKSRMGIGDTVAVIGAGPIGLLVLQACLATGAGHVFVVEPLEKRRTVASKTGASAVFNPFEADVGKIIAARTDGLRAEIAFDCVGSQASFDTAVQVTGRRARICIVGLALRPVEVPFARLWGHEKELTFSTGYDGEFPAAIAYLADKRVKVEELVSSRIKLEDLVEQGMKPLISDPSNFIKVLVYP